MNISKIVTIIEERTITMDNNVFLEIEKKWKKMKI
jgi:hypothetical protein